MNQEIINKIIKLINSSQLTNEELESFYQNKIANISSQRRTDFNREFDKVIYDQVRKQVNDLISPTEIYPVVEKIIEDRINQIVEEKLKSKIASIVNSNITAELQEIILETVQKKINNLVAIDENELYELKNNQKED